MFHKTEMCVRQGGQQIRPIALLFYNLFWCEFPASEFKSCLWHPASLCLSPLFPHHPQLWSMNDRKTKLTKGLKFILDHDRTTGDGFCVCWQYKAWQGCVLWAAHFKGKTRLSPPFTVGMWHWQSVRTASSFLPAHAHANVHLSANWWQALCVYVFVFVESSGQKVCLGKCWQSWSLFHSQTSSQYYTFPTHVTADTQPPSHKHRNSPCIYTHTIYNIPFNHWCCV